MNAYERYKLAIENDENSRRQLSCAWFMHGGFSIQLLGRYWFWVDDESGHEWEYAADSWDEMFAIVIEQFGMTLKQVMEGVDSKELEFE